jgi:hypothetical protein
MSNVAQISKNNSIGPIINKSRKFVQKMQEFSIFKDRTDTVL